MKVTIFALCALVLSGLALGPDMPQEQPPIVACASDDGSSDTYPCYWNAQEQGNGQGTSFIVTERP